MLLHTPFFLKMFTSLKRYNRFRVKARRSRRNAVQLDSTFFFTTPRGGKSFSFFLSKTLTNNYPSLLQNSKKSLVSFLSKTFFLKKESLSYQVVYFYSLLSVNQRALANYTTYNLSLKYLGGLFDQVTTLNHKLHTLSSFLKNHIEGVFSWKGWSYGFLDVYRTLLLYTNLYRDWYLNVIHLFYKNFKRRNRTNVIPIYYLYWNFTPKNRLFITLRNSFEKNYNYLFLYSGIFLKFFKNRKPLRKSKLFKILMVKFFRKILLSSSIQNVFLFVKNTSPLFLEFYKLLLTPSIIPYKTVGTKGLYDDSIVNRTKKLFVVRKVLFLKTHSFAKMKTRKKGRIKRKITRRIIKKNQILD